MASTSKKFRKGGDFSGSYSRGQSSGGYPARPIQSSLQAVAGGPSQTSQHFSEFGGYPQTSSFSQRPMLDSRNCYGCGETGHIGKYCPKQSYRPPIAKVMVVIKSVGVAGKLELLQRNMVGATGRQEIGPIVMLSPGGLKQKHLMLSSQVIFWSVIAWLLYYYLILDPHFHMYLPHLLLVVIYIVICLTCLFVSLLLWVSL